MKKVLSLALGLLIVSFSLVSCSDSNDPTAIPKLGVNEGTVLQNGESKVISSNELKYTDIDSDDIELIYTITVSPEYGKLVNSDAKTVSITSFTQQDIVDKKIVYIHDGSSSLTDSFTFQITDGNNTSSNLIFNISIGEKQIRSFYVLNEGSTNGSISLIDKDGKVTSNYFKSVNDIPLGKYPQSMVINDKYAFIVVTTTNGSGYVEIVTASDFKHHATITGLSYPREIAIVGNKAYLSNGTGVTGTYPNQVKKNNEVYVIDLNTNAVTSQISVGAGPEKLIVSGKKLYVANSGGWSNDDNTVSVINLDTDKVVKTITVKSCPKDMVKDANGDVWVYCSGVADYSNYPAVSYTNSGISKIDGDTYEVTSFALTSLSTTGIKNIAISKDKKTVYYMSDAVYAMNITDTALPTTKFIDATFYGMDVNPVNGDLWMCKSVDAKTAGSVVVYSKESKKLNEYTVGSMPNSTMFSY